jgi:non-ribosomal peptide synthetase component F
MFLHDHAEALGDALVADLARDARQETPAAPAENNGSDMSADSLSIPDRAVAPIASIARNAAIPPVADAWPAVGLRALRCVRTATRSRSCSRRSGGPTATSTASPTWRRRACPRSASRAGDCVGIFMDRSAQAVVAMLAHPQARRRVRAFRPRGAGRAPRGARLVPRPRIRVLAIAGPDSAPDWFRGARAGDRRAGAGSVGPPSPRSTLHPLELAYVIYTSGSTNEAKGVCATHRAVLDLVAGADYCGFVADDVVYHGMSIAFDGSTFEIWGALLSAPRSWWPRRASASRRSPTWSSPTASRCCWLSTGVFNALGQDALRRLAGVRVLLAGRRRDVGRARRAVPGRGWARRRQRLRSHRSHHLLALPIA